jgi:hypothetical protein
VVKGDIQQLYARELAPLPKAPFTVGALSGEVESVSPPAAEQDDNSTRLTLPLGTGTAMQCFVYPKAMDPGAQLLSIVKAISKVDVRSVRPTDVVVVGEHAAIFAEVQYLAKTAGGTAAGEVKLMAYAHPITPMLCLHDEVGYNAAFKRIAVGLAATLKLEGHDVRIPEFVDIAVEQINGHPVGFARSSVVTGDDGNKVYIETSSSLVPRSAQDLMVEDETRMETLDKHGNLAKVVYAKSEGGEVSEDLTLSHVSGNEYRYEGTHLGKKASGTLKTKGPKGLRTDIDVRHAEGKLVAPDAKGGDMKIEEYHPDLDAGAPVEVLYHPLSKKDRTLTMTLGTAQVTITLDANGLSQKGEMPVGGATVTMERVFVRGSF